jgi:hypothetical protein
MGLAVDAEGVSSRFLQADSGEPIPYLVDADFLPSGMTVSQALTAVSNAAASWTAVTGVAFEFQGLVSFGMPASDVMAEDGRLRIQLHDIYASISNPSTLGIGGRANTVIVPPLAAGLRSGGNVAGHEFHKSIRGYVVLKHTSATMQNPVTFEEVLCHEIGHALSMAHSSENPGESDAELKDAIMYFQAHADGRGARLGTWDLPVIRQAYPPTDTPPFTHPRIMDITTAGPSQPSVGGINEIQLRAYDLQNPSPSLQITGPTSNAGEFSLEGSTLKFTPAGVFDAPRLDPADVSFYDVAYVRCADGTHASAPVTVRTLSLRVDNFPFLASDGIPDHWMTTYFGDPDPAAGPNRGPNDDHDADGFTNREEYQMGSDPTDPDSHLRITGISATGMEWQANPYHLYEIHGTTDFQAWTRARPPVVATGTNGVVSSVILPGMARHNFRIFKVP